MLQPPSQNDNQAASSAKPDTDKLPSWDDEGWHEYLFAVDRHDRFDWLVEHGYITTDEEAAAYWEELDEIDDEF